MKTLVLVLATRATPFPALADAIRRTWASVRVTDADVLFYQGGDRLVIEGRDLTLPVPDVTGAPKLLVRRLVFPMFSRCVNTHWV